MANITKEWVRLEIKNTTNKRLKSALFWKIVTGLLVPTLLGLFGFCLHLNNRIDELFFHLFDAFRCFVP